MLNGYRTVNCKSKEVYKLLTCSPTPPVIHDLDNFNPQYVVINLIKNDVVFNAINKQNELCTITINSDNLIKIKKMKGEK